MPDFFRGKPLVESDLGDIPKLLKWVGEHGSLEVVSHDELQIHTHRKITIPYFHVDYS